MLIVMFVAYCHSDPQYILYMSQIAKSTPVGNFFYSSLNLLVGRFAMALKVSLHSVQCTHYAEHLAY